MRFLVYSAVSTVLTAFVIASPLVNSPNFYSAAIEVYNNSVFMIILGNMCLIMLFVIGKILQMMFFGHLHTLERDRLYESAWYTLTESVLLVPLLRDDSKLQFLAFFGILLFIRIFHWICADRVDIIFQTVAPPSYINHARLATAIILLGLTDLHLIRYWVMSFQYSSDSDTNSVMVPTFSFECLLLFNSIFNTAGKYLLNVIESIYLHNHEDEDIWDKKTLYTFYLELVTKLSRLLAYLALFFFILLPYKLIPLHIFRDCYVTFVSLASLVQTHIRAQNAKRQIETVVRNITREELQEIDDVCIICREEMTVEDDQPARTVPKRLICGHTIHFGCLTSWLERSLRCPTCRRSVMDGSFPNTPNATPPAPQQNRNPPAAPDHQAQNNEAANHTPTRAVNADDGTQSNLTSTAAASTSSNSNNSTNDIINSHIVEPNGTANSSSSSSAQSQSSSVIQNGNHIYSNISHSSQNAAPSSTASNYRPFALKNHVELPAGFQIPRQWGTFEARKTIDGRLQVHISENIWVDIMVPSDEQKFSAVPNDKKSKESTKELTTESSGTTSNITPVTRAGPFSAEPIVPKADEESSQNNIATEAHEEELNTSSTERVEDASE